MSALPVHQNIVIQNMHELHVKLACELVGIPAKINQDFPVLPVGFFFSNH